MKTFTITSAPFLITNSYNFKEWFYGTTKSKVGKRKIKVLKRDILNEATKALSKEIEKKQDDLLRKTFGCHEVKEPSIFTKRHLYEAEEKLTDSFQNKNR